VARAAVAAGADLVNDISGGTFDPEMFPVVAELGVPIVLMHIRGTPATMQQMTNYQDLMGEICEFLSTQIERAIASGINRSKIIIDPGIGFAKTYEQSLEILGCSFISGAISEKFYRADFKSTRSQSQSLGNGGGLLRSDRGRCRHPPSSRCPTNA
jgi:hypothetical protein